MIRLFLAIELPEQARKRLFNIAHQLPHAREVPQHQIHLTLKFIGDQQRNNLQKIANTLLQFSFPPFDLTIHGVGIFNRQNIPAVIWAGITPSHELCTLHRTIETFLAPFIPAEKRRFTPHITLARTQKKFSPQTAETFFMQYKNFTLPPFSVKHFTLFESRLSHYGATHIEQARFELIKKHG